MRTINPMYLIWFIIVLSFLYIIYYFNFRSSIPSKELVRKSVEINGKIFLLEIADNYKSREQGLMNRENLNEMEGMLFIFPVSGIYPFWMKNTLIPLDIIWLNNNKEVVFIKENARPCERAIVAVCQTIVPTKPARYVIELNAGNVNKLNIKLGQKIDIQR
jgi:uncharacterized protein